MATNCDSCGHRTNEVSWKEACCSVPLSLSSQCSCWEGNWIWGIVRRCFMLSGEAAVPGLEWPLG